MNKEFMQEAITMATDNIKSGKGGPFGAVVVKDNKIIARASNTVTSSNDPTAHAEINAIRMACLEIGSFQLDDCEIYSSCEPCPMCLGAVYWARPKAVYFAASKHDAESAGFDDSFIYDEIIKDPSSRKIPFIQMEIESALFPFEQWNKTELKTEY
ncbi:MAG: nucleoside deaminase [Bacteroidales bacterium]|nr:nucleoside deaminase [Bacteroidales bacterium]